MIPHSLTIKLVITRISMLSYSLDSEAILFTKFSNPHHLTVSGSSIVLVGLDNELYRASDINSVPV